MLAGNVPYYDGTSSDEMLHARLTQSSDQPLVLQDLQLLSDVRKSSIAKNKQLYTTENKSFFNQVTFQWVHFLLIIIFSTILFGGDETRSGYVQYVEAI